MPENTETKLDINDILAAYRERLANTEQSLIVAQVSTATEQRLRIAAEARVEELIAERRSLGDPTHE